MKTTFDIPENLMVRVKEYAVENNRKLNDTIAELLERGIARSSTEIRPFDPGEPFRIKRKGTLNVEDIEAAIAAGRDDTF